VHAKHMPAQAISRRAWPELSCTRNRLKSTPKRTDPVIADSRHARYSRPDHSQPRERMARDQRRL